MNKKPTIWLVRLFSVVLAVAAACQGRAQAQSVPQKVGADCSEQYITNDPSDSGGAIVETDDGHMYRIDSIDRVDSQLWLAGDDIVVCWAAYRYKDRVITLYTIRNGDDKDDAQRIH